jgi:single-strand DNA-binding protein
MNKIIIIGRLTRDPEVKYTQNGKAMAKLNIAVDRKFKDASGNKITDFFGVTLWGKTAEVVGKHCQKGSQLCVEGSMQREEWMDKNGEKKSTWSLNGENIEFLGSKGDKKPRRDELDNEEPSSLDEELERNQPYGF